MDPTIESLKALSNLRDPTDLLWYVIPLLALVLYVYGVEIHKSYETKDFSTIFAGLALLGMDFFNEIWNGLVFHFTNYSAVWTTPSDSAYTILIGWNIEIFFMFCIAGIIFTKFMPKDKKMKMFGIPNRWFNIILFTIFCVFIEVLLNQAGKLVWVYPFWNFSIGGIWLILLIGYFPFFMVSAWVYDMGSWKKQATFVGLMFTLEITAFIIFTSIGWI
jgi:hypothetical protein